MKNSLLLRALTLLTSVALAVAASTAEAKLTVGDPAPKLQVAKWVQGDPVKAFDTNHVYIVEFWATWCGPCRTSIPHLNELSKKFKDQGVIAIGQNMAEPDDSGVAAFVKKMGDQMTYRVALDDKSQETNGFMAVNWMKAADQNGIPTAFVINKQGRIAWIGHPMGLDEKLLEAVLADKFDMAKAAADYEKQQQENQKWMAVNKKLREALKQNKWDDAEAAVVELEKTVPEPMRFHYGTTRLQILLGRKDYDAAYKLAESLSDEHKDNAGFQNGIAWTMATHEGLEKRGLLVAEKIAESANTVAQGKSSAVLDTLARIQFLLGKKPEAIATEQKAVNAAADDGEKRALEKILADYQQGKLPKADD
jgi:thiol-disulfide isomerase/thioredoxin